MYGIEDLERATGFTVSQVRDRLGLLSPILGDDLHRGKRGKVLVGDAILSALRRMVELEREGLSPRVARDRILGELGNGHGNGGASFAEGLSTSVGELRALREMIEELRRDRDHWRNLALNLQDRVLALPPGKGRNPWWWPLRRFVFGG